MPDFLRDLRYGLRMLMKSPGYSFAAALALALGIGLCTAMFSIVYGAMFRGLPFEESDRIMHMENARPSRDEPSLEVYIHDFLEWRQRQTSFEGFAAFDGGSLNLGGAGEVPERLEGCFVTSDFMKLLRVRPILGRDFIAADDAPDAEAVVLLGYGVWKSRYGGDPQVVGRKVRANGEPATIIGVMPQGFAFPVNQQAWTTLRLDPLRTERGQGRTLEVLGRLKPRVTLERARAELAGIAKAIAAEHPETNEGREARVKPIMEEFIEGPLRALFYLMLGACLFVLLIACTNVASLMMARASRRTREIAIRSALGAQRGRVIAQLLTESLLLALGGAVLGILLAEAGVKGFNAAISGTDPPYWLHIAIDPPALLFALGATLLAALLSGLMPALQASRTEITEVLKDEGRGTSSLRMGLFTRGVLIFEVALSCLLLVGAGLMVKSIVMARTLDLGFEAEGILTARIALFEKAYPEKERRAAFYQTVADRLRENPNVEAAAMGSILPASGAWTTRYALSGRSYASEEDHPVAAYGPISPGYFEVFGLRILQGRDFDQRDATHSAPVVIVNESFARAAWPGESPLGRQIRLIGGEEAEKEPWRTVIGMVSDSQMKGFNAEDAEKWDGFYIPLAQEAPQFASVLIKVRQGTPESLSGPLREIVTDLDRDLPVYFVRSMQETMDRNLFFSNLFGTLFAIFGASALLLASIGIYGVISFSVHQRTQEIGIRMALGAQRNSVLRLIFRQGMLQLGVGLLVGLILAWLGSKVLAVFLIGIQPHDPGTFATIILVLTAVALFACWIPARRAAGTDPLVAIRYD
ncbi:MAG TPA: ABC transporter permease [Thermoanaerobaculia bacterium]